MSTDFGWMWRVVFDAFYGMKYLAPKYFKLIGWSIDLRRKDTPDVESTHIGCMSENNDELPLSRWFGTDTTNTTLEDMQKLFNRFDTCCITLTYRNNGVEVVQSAVVDTFRNKLPAYMVADFEAGRCSWPKPQTGIFLKGKNNELTDKIQEDRQECRDSDA